MEWSFYHRGSTLFLLKIDVIFPFIELFALIFIRLYILIIFIAVIGRLTGKIYTFAHAYKDFEVETNIDNWAEFFDELSPFISYSQIRSSLYYNFTPKTRCYII
jgi:hypothetical protein